MRYEEPSNGKKSRLLLAAEEKKSRGHDRTMCLADEIGRKERLEARIALERNREKALKNKKGSS